jgi:large subunit ribosomal protein L16
MLLNNIKYTKKFNKRIKGINLLNNNTKIVKGSIGVLSVNSSFLNLKQMVNLLKTLKRIFKKNIKIWKMKAYDLNITKKPLESRMGKGKGAAKYACFALKRGQFLLELNLGLGLPVNQNIIKHFKNKLSGDVIIANKI